MQPVLDASQLPILHFACLKVKDLLILVGQGPADVLQKLRTRQWIQSVQDRLSHGLKEAHSPITSNEVHPRHELPGRSLAYRCAEPMKAVESGLNPQEECLDDSRRLWCIVGFRNMYKLASIRILRAGQCNCCTRLILSLAPGTIGGCSSG